MSKYRKLITSAVLVSINIVLAFFAVFTKVPMLYLDTLGTMTGVRIFGLKEGILIAIAGAVIVGLSYDIYAIYYLPTYIMTAIVTYLIEKNEKLKRKNFLIRALLISVASGTVGAIITAYIFGGITSSGSAYILALLKRAGLSLVASSFIVQLSTEYIDKILMVYLSDIILKKLK